MMAHSEKKKPIDDKTNNYEVVSTKFESTVNMKFFCVRFRFDSHG